MSAVPMTLVPVTAGETPPPAVIDVAADPEAKPVAMNQASVHPEPPLYVQIGRAHV